MLAASVLRAKSSKNSSYVPVKVLFCLALLNFNINSFSGKSIKFLLTAFPLATCFLSLSN